MTLTLPYQPTFIVADGTTRSFNYLFDAVSADFIGVAIKRTDGSVYQPVFAKDLDQQAITLTDSEPTPGLGALVCIYRNTPEVQDVAFRTLDGYNARAMENILSKIVAMIQETRDVADHTTIRTTFPQRDVSIQVITDEDDTATVVIDAQNKQLKRGLYFKIADGNLMASQDGKTFIQMPKSADIKEFRQVITDDNHYVFQYRVGTQWFSMDLDAVESLAQEALDKAETGIQLANAAQATADEALEKAEQGIADAAQAQKTADVALAVTYQLEASKANKTDVYNKQEADAKYQAETTARTQADAALQAQIDAQDAKSDVVDVVGTYSELQAYDTSTLTAEDVIKVLSDSTHDDAESYYRWHNSTWVYIGGRGPFYTKAETDAEILVETTRAEGAEAALQQDIDRIDGKTAELDADLSSKVDKNQGTENVGKFLKVGTDGNVMLGEGGGGGGGVTEVYHDDTLTGKGTDVEPLSVVKPKIILRRW